MRSGFGMITGMITDRQARRLIPSAVRAFSAYGDKG
jgi:hypothetical protein